jgi:hypothetical protein
MPSYDRAPWALRTSLDSWAGIGHVAVGMHRQGFDLQLTRYDERGWRATFYTTGMEHSPTSATGAGWERTPWHATQRAAWEALNKLREDTMVSRLKGRQRLWTVIFQQHFRLRGSIGHNRSSPAENSGSLGSRWCGGHHPVGDAESGRLLDLMTD